MLSGSGVYQNKENSTQRQIRPTIRFPLTNKNSHKEPGQPLLFHLLDLGLLAGGRGFAHDSEGIHMSDWAYGSRCEPRQAEKRTDGTQDDNEEKIQMEPWAFHQATLLLTDDQSEEVKVKMKTSWEILVKCML